MSRSQKGNYQRENIQAKSRNEGRMPNDYLGGSGDAWRRAVEAATRSANESIKRQMGDAIKSVNVQNSTALEAFEKLTQKQSQVAANALKVVDASNLRLGEQMTEVAAKLSATHLALVQVDFEKFARFAALAGPKYPENLREIEDLDLTTIEEVVFQDGVPLLGVPRQAIAKEILEASDLAGRQSVLLRRGDDIREDCTNALKACDEPAVADHVSAAKFSIEAHEAGNYYAAQALAASIVDAIMRTALGSNYFEYTPSKKGGRTSDLYDEMELWQFIAFAPIWKTYTQFHAEDGDPVPADFSRHATAHTVSPIQFNETNSIHAILFACSLIKYCDLDPECLSRKATP